jgi:hypothetical protein
MMSTKPLMDVASAVAATYQILQNMCYQIACLVTTNKHGSLGILNKLGLASYGCVSQYVL